jgi:hypothetical protein
MSLFFLGRMGLVLAACGAGLTVATAQLPTARLDGVSPRGGEAGREVDVTLQGVDLEDASSLVFSHPGLTATLIEPGRFKVTIGQGVPTGGHEVRAVGRYGVSTSSLWVVGSLPEIIEPAGNSVRATAPVVAFPVTLNGVATADTSDFFRIAAVKGQKVYLDCAAQRIDAPLHAVLSVRDPAGVEIKRAQRTLDRDPVTEFIPSVDGEYTIELHDATWRGGPAFAYRLTVSTEEAAAVLPSSTPLAGALLVSASGAGVEEVEPNDDAAAALPLAVPVEVVGRLDRDWFTFSSAAARSLVVEVISQRVGAPSDPVMVISKVAAGADGAAAVVGEFDDSPGVGGTERFRLGTRDPVARLEAEAGVTYRIFITDRFNSGGPYRLVVRDPRPDFQVLAMPESPVTDGKALMRWTVVLRRQGTAALALAVVRTDGFDETVVIRAGGLPAGVTAADCVIPPGQSSGLMVLRAAADAAPWTGALTLTAEAGAVTRPVREVVSRWSVADAATERVDLRLGVDGLRMAVIEAGGVPLQTQLAGDGATLETSLGATLEVPVSFVRDASHKGFKGEWEAALWGLPGQRAWQPAKPAADAAEAKLTLSLTKKDGNQFVPGTWTLFAATRGTVQWQPDDKVPVRELRDASFSTPVRVKIDSSPVVISAPDESVVGPGGTASLAIKLDRRFGFAEAVDVSLQLPAGVTALKAPVLSMAKDVADGALVVEAAAGTAAGRHECRIEAKCQWNGEELIARRDVIIEIKP